jgi:hypothetical protein
MTSTRMHWCTQEMNYTPFLTVKTGGLSTRQWGSAGAESQWSNICASWMGCYSPLWGWEKVARGGHGGGERNFSENGQSKLNFLKNPRKQDYDVVRYHIVPIWWPINHRYGQMDQGVMTGVMLMNRLWHQIHQPSLVTVILPYKLDYKINKCQKIHLSIAYIMSLWWHF